MACFKHWIPAFAGRLRASSAARSRRRSTTCIHAGVPSRRIQDFLSINDGGGCGQEFGRHDNGAIGMATTPFRPPSSFQRRLESRKAGRGVKGWQGLSDGVLGCCGCHSRYAGMARFNHWIPACAGMTVGLKSGIRQEWQKDCRDGNPLFLSSSSFRRRPESTPTGM